MILRLAPLALLLFTTACVGKSDVDRFFADIRNAFRGDTPRATAAATATADYDGIGPETRPLSRGIRTIDEPWSDELQSFRTVSLLDGSAGRFDIELKQGGMHVRDADGCQWHRGLDWFAPSLSWRDCGSSRNWHTGTARVSVDRPIYPLRVGSRGAYTRSATSHTGRSYTRTTRCTVENAVEVVRDAGQVTPAYVVACDDGRRERRTWYAPGVGPLAFVQTHHKKGVERAWRRVD